MVKEWKYSTRKRRTTQLKHTFAIDLVHFLEILQISQPAGKKNRITPGEIKIS